MLININDKLVNIRYLRDITASEWAEMGPETRDRLCKTMEWGPGLLPAVSHMKQMTAHRAQSADA